MTDEESGSLSPTVAQVIGQFIAAMRADEGMAGDGIDRLEKLLRKAVVPKPDEINAALFPPSPDGQS